MPVGRQEHVTEQVLTTLREFLPRTTPLDRDKLIGAGLGITGWDSIDLIERLEHDFQLDLRPLVDANTVHLKPRLIDRLLGREHGPPDADVTVGQLIDYIAQHAADQT
jgi:hypothetical protein